MANSDVLELLAKIKFDASELERGLKQASDKAKTFAQNVNNNFGAKIGNALTNFGNGLTKLGNNITNIGRTASVVTAAVGAVVGAAFNKAKTFIGTYESAMVVFRRKLEGGEEAAKGMYNTLVDIAKGSAYAQEHMVEAGKTLVAMGLDADKTSKYVQAATDAVAAFGGTGQDVEELAHRFGRMSQQTNLYTMDLNMLVDKGVPAWDILATKYHKTTAEVKDMARKGLLPAKEGLETLTNAMEETNEQSEYFKYSVAGMAKELKSGTLTGTLDSLNTSFRTFSLRLLDLDPRTKSGQANIKKLNTAISNFGQTLESVGSKFSFVGGWIGQGLQNVTTFLKNFNNSLNSMPKKKAESIAKFITVIAAAGPTLLVVGKAMTALGKSFNTLGGIVSVVSKGIGGLTTALGATGSVASAVVSGGITALIAAFATLYTTNENFRKSCNEVFGEIASSVKGLWDVVSPIFSGFGDMLYGLAEIISTVVLLAFNSLGDAIQFVVGLLSPFQEGFELVGNFLSDFGKSLQGFFDPLIDSTMEATGDISEATATAINDFEKLESDATSSLNKLKWSSETISEDTKNEIIGKYKTMKDRVIEILEEQKNQTLKSVKEAFDDTATITEEEKNKTLEALEKKYNDEKISVEEGEKRISEIIAKASEEHRALTEEEYNEITSIKDKMHNTVIEALSQSKTEQLAIMEDLKSKSGQITAEQATEAIKKSIEQKDNVLNTAREEYEERLRTAAKLKQDLGEEYSEVADKIIEEAQRQYDSTVETAKQQHIDVVKEAQNAAAEHVDKVNWETGEVKSGWDMLKESLRNSWSDTTKLLIGSETEKRAALAESILKTGKLTQEQEKQFLDSWKTIDDNAEIKWNAIKKKIVSSTDEAASETSKNFEDLTSDIDSSTSLAKRYFDKNFSEIEKTASNKSASAETSTEKNMNALRKAVDEKTSLAERSLNSHFASMSNDVSTNMANAKSNTSSGVGGMERIISGANWSFPRLKMPHFSVSGGFSLNPPSIPHFSIEWYKKGAVLNKPTAFGINALTGKIMAGGEAGAEAVAPIDVLQDYVKSAVDNSNSNKSVANALSAILDIISDYLPMLSNRRLILNTGAVVGELSPEIDGQLGVITRLRERGN